MLRLIGTAAFLALAAANPALGQGKGDDDGEKSRGREHAEMDHGPGKNERDRGEDRAGKSDSSRSVKAKAERIVERTGAARSERARELRGGDRLRVIDRTVVRNLDRDGEWRLRSGWDGDGDWDGRGRIFASVPACPPGLAKKHNGCLPPGLARHDRDRYFDYAYRPILFGIPLRTRADYVYYDGYLIPASGSGLSYIPLLGGALAVGRVWPEAYPSLPLADWQRGYFGFDDPRDYRYADNVVYRVDPETAAIEAVAALLTGNDFVVGQPMPLGYDVYNVPGPYRDEYYDTDDALYRYADGRIYEIDPLTLLIAKAIDLVV